MYHPTINSLGTCKLSSLIRSCFTISWYKEGVRALLELVVMHNADLRALSLEYDSYLKAGMAALTYLGTSSVVEPLPVLQTFHEAGVGGWIGAMLVGGATYLAAGSHNGFRRLLLESDEDDDLGIQRLINYAEDAWALFGPWVLLAFPLLVLVLVGAVLGAFYMLRKWAEAKEEKAKIPCQHCRVWVRF